jgi:hypothetical protein
MRGTIAKDIAVARMYKARTIVPDFNVIVYRQIRANTAG